MNIFEEIWEIFFWRLWSCGLWCLEVWQFIASVSQQPLPPSPR